MRKMLLALITLGVLFSVESVTAAKKEKMRRAVRFNGGEPFVEERLPQAQVATLKACPKKGEHAHSSPGWCAYPHLYFKTAGWSNAWLIPGPQRLKFTVRQLSLRHGNMIYSSRIPARLVCELEFTAQAGKTYIAIGDETLEQEWQYDPWFSEVNLKTLGISAFVKDSETGEILGECEKTRGEGSGYTGEADSTSSGPTLGETLKSMSETLELYGKTGGDKKDSMISKTLLIAVEGTQLTFEEKRTQRVGNSPVHFPVIRTMVRLEDLDPTTCVVVGSSVGCLVEDLKELVRKEFTLTITGESRVFHTQKMIVKSKYPGAKRMADSLRHAIILSRSMKKTESDPL